jgi:organic radical activating enzyme
MDMVNVPNGNAAITIWFAGCSMKCDECHNIKLQNSSNGTDMEVQDAIDTILDASRATKLKDLVLLGGEPLEQDLEDLSLMCDILKVFGMQIHLYTGRDFNEIPHEILKSCVWVKSGRYDKNLHVDGFPSSSNQHVYCKIEKNNWRTMA